MARFFLQLAILSAYFGICGVGEFQLLPGVVWCGVVWCGSLKHQKKTFCPVTGPTVSLLRGPPPEVAQQAGSTLSVTLFTIKRVQFSSGQTSSLLLRVMATEGLPTAYVGAYTCTAVAESDVFHVLLSGRHRY